jgi:hypothetical protein
VANIQRTAVPWVLGAATAQLILIGVASPAGAARNIAGCALALALPLAASHVVVRWWRWLHVMTIVGAIGGLGMLAGALIDAHGSALPPCHVHGGALVTWMNGAMLAGCIPACVWLSPDCRSVRSWLGHAGCFVGMMVGMYLGGRWLTPIMDAMVTTPATHHIAMLLGMMLGAAGGYRSTHVEVAFDLPGSITSSTSGSSGGRRAGRSPVPESPTA